MLRRGNKATLSFVLAKMSQPSSADAMVVLVVEDEPLVRIVEADILEEAGFEVIEADNADAAFELLKRHDDVRVVLTDVDMPGSLNGFEFARLVAQGWPGVGVLVVSGKAAPQPGDMPRTGAFMQKPYEPRAIVERVRELARLGLSRDLAAAQTRG